MSPKLPRELAGVEAAAAGPPPPNPNGLGRSYALRFSGSDEHVVGLGDLLEALLGLLVARIAVRVVLARELAVGLLDLLVGGVLAEPEGLVVVRSIGHRGVLSARHDHARRPDHRTRPARIRAGRPRRSSPARRPRRAAARSPRGAGGRTARPRARTARSRRATARRSASACTSLIPTPGRRPSSVCVSIASTARSRLSTAGSSSRASLATPRSCAAAASRGGPLAVVLEVGLRPLRELEVLVGLLGLCRDLLEIARRASASARPRPPAARLRGRRPPALAVSVWGVGVGGRPGRRVAAPALSPGAPRGLVGGSGR